VMARQMPVSERLNERKIGQTLEVMVDEIIEIDSEDIIRDFNTATDEELARMVTLYEGRTRYDAPEIDCSVTFTSHNSELIPGDIVNVLITGTYEYDLDGIEV